MYPDRGGGKGAKDRNVIISPALLAALRDYWRAVGPRHWLFPSQEYLTPLGIESAQRAFTAAKRRAGIEKVGGIHALRHAFATHQLEAGMPVHQLQRLLGHQNIHRPCATCIGCRITGKAGTVRI